MKDWLISFAKKRNGHFALFSFLITPKFTAYLFSLTMSICDLLLPVLGEMKTFKNVE